MHERLSPWRELPSIAPREEALRETIEKSRQAYFCQDLTYPEFLWTQLKFTRKRWWVFQAALLVLAGLLLPSLEDQLYRVRSIGVIGCLFVVILLPELWRNREWDAVQVEAACLYSLRQIYAARITLFGIVDVTLLTLFSLNLGRMGFTPLEVIAQFLLPVTVTACICFYLLCSRQDRGELASVAACLLWCAAWWLLLLKESLYERILPAVWVGLFTLALALLALAVRRAVRTTNQIWEVICA